MGIFDLFNKKKEPLTALQDVREDLIEGVNESETTSSQLENHIERLEKLQKDQWTDGVKLAHESLEKNQDHYWLLCLV